MHVRSRGGGLRSRDSGWLLRALLDANLHVELLEMTANRDLFDRSLLKPPAAAYYALPVGCLSAAQAGFHYTAAHKAAKTGMKTRRNWQSCSIS